MSQLGNGIGLEGPIDTFAITARHKTCLTQAVIQGIGDGYPCVLQSVVVTFRRRAINKQGEAVMTLDAIAYCSCAVPGLTLRQVDELARDAAARNLSAGVTAVMLTDGSRFLQYLEGSKEAVSLIYPRIMNARSHMGLVELGRCSGGPRRFRCCPMRLLLVKPEDLRIAVVSDWRGMAYRGELDIFQVRTGIERVIELIDPFNGVNPPAWMLAHGSPFDGADH